MPEDLDQPPRGYTTADVQTQARADAPKSRWRSRLKWGLVLVIITPIVAFALYTWSALHFAYGEGERAGFVQKFAKEGWLCKTWEGELAMANLPGTTPQIFHFTVRDDAVARQITQSIGQRVSLSFDEHRGVPTSCFGDTEYYVTNVKLAGR
jgi:hypothetical protein